MLKPATRTGFSLSGSALKRSVKGMTSLEHEFLDAGVDGGLPNGINVVPSLLRTRSQRHFSEINDPTETEQTSRCGSNRLLTAGCVKVF